MWKLVIVFLYFTTLATGQYPDEGEKDGLLHNPPGAVPPMPPTDPPGYDPELLATPTPSSQPSPGLRAPPLPTWTQKTEESSSDTLSSGDGNQETHVGEESGDGSGNASGTSEGSAGVLEEGSADSEDFFEPSGEGAQEDSFPDIMHSLDEEAALLGVDCPSDVIFIIDATSSVRTFFEQYVHFVEKVIEGLDIQPSVDRVGAIVYSSAHKQRVKISLGEHKDKGSLIAAVESLPFFSGITATGEALKFAANHTEGRRQNLTLTFVVLTDGYSYDLIESGARLLREVPNSKVYAVTIGESYLRKELDLITGNPANVLIGSMSYGALVKRIKSCEARIRAMERKDELVRPGEFLSDRFQNRKPVNENVEEHKPKEEIVQKTEQLPVKDCRYDIGIIFDSSGSLEKNFQKQLKFATTLVEQMPISPNATRVAIIQFAGKTKLRVLADFAQKKSAAELKTIIGRSHFFSGTTFTNGALKTMADLFQKSKRADAKLKVVLFTDGYSAEDTSEGAEALKSQGVVVYTVGISTEKSTGLNMKELHGMATSPNHFFNASDFVELSKNFPSSQNC
ncbi:hypothetical protein CRE_00574 [Caenorhabditis remanei]|uniref:Uncharacterized protein n=1 Tax=Caenorhabditis remanei TaxID=31234 RepID=E3LD76_CAERE|nr:hypothetical protein CRE_00574 [Caenorhabditis remanei]